LATPLGKTPAHRGQRRINWQQELNDQQYKAVTTIDDPLLVIAGAGTGKTRTLVYRVAYLVDQGIHPGNILLLTFTRRAAREMLRRATALLDERCSRVPGGTFHSFARRVLKRYAPLIGYVPDFTIIDTTDAQDLIDRLRTQLGLADKKVRFPRATVIRDIISKAINTGQSIEQVIIEDYAFYYGAASDIEQLAETYQKAKRERMLMDFDDLLVHARDLLRHHDNVRSQLAREFRYILVDEYQDTNRLQAEIACLLAAEHSNLMVVGDDSQSIYRFRGADLRNILEFPQLFPDCSQVTLEENYRSTQPILDLANAIIAHAREGYPKQLYSQYKDGPKPFYVRPEDEHDQSLYICDRILQLREEGVPLHQIAVLARAAYFTDDLQLEMRRRNIPFVVYGGRRFAEAAHVKDVLAFLRISVNPRDELAWSRALQLLEGIGPRRSEALIGVVVGEGRGHEGLLDPRFQKKTYTKELQALYELLQRLAKIGPDVVSAIDEILRFYQPLFEQRYVDDYPLRAPDLEALLTIAQRYQDIPTFLADFALEPYERRDIGGEVTNEERPVVLSTIHSAKGLEWHTVFIVHVLSGCLPMNMDQKRELEEERRLFYVAITRAKRELHILAPISLWSQPRGLQYDERGFAQPSPFILEIENWNSLIQPRPEMAADLPSERRQEITSDEGDLESRRSRLQRILSHFRSRHQDL